MSSWPWRRPLHSCGTLVLLLAVAGCGGDGGSDPQIPAELTLNSDRRHAGAEGQSHQLTATVVDADGDPLPDATVTWESSDAAVVAVTATGLLIGQGPGTAQVTATAGDVRPPPM